MKESILISITIVLIYIFLFCNTPNLKMIEMDNKQILVQDLPQAENSAELLNDLINNMYKLRNHLVQNIDQYKHVVEYANCYESKLKPSILLLSTNFNKNRTKIYENAPDSEYTSYSVNKGQEFVFCLRCKKTKKLHKLNLLMYVAVHEMAHAGCKEIGHTQLFNIIFSFYLREAIKINIYKFQNYHINSVNYCGLDLHTNILNQYNFDNPHSNFCSK